jgi:pimeloyl-ACP methyl ester carboxylesterase
MPTLDLADDVRLSYEVHGEGTPVLLFAPGGMRSAAALWDRAPFHPVRELSPHFRVIAMDQRNAAQSRAPVRASDGWDTYAADHVALLDRLGIERCHLLGMCIGSAFALRLLVSHPERTLAAVLAQPIGFDGKNRVLYQQMFDGWGEELARSRPDVSPDALAGMKSHLYDGDFAYSVTRDEVRRIEAPLLVLRGDDEYHPAPVSEEIAQIAPHAELVHSWKTGADVARAASRVRSFLEEHTPRR